MLLSALLGLLGLSGRRWRDAGQDVVHLILQTRCKGVSHIRRHIVREGLQVQHPASSLHDMAVDFSVTCLHYVYVDLCSPEQLGQGCALTA